MGLIPEDVIAQILDKNDIVEVIGSYIPLKRAGRNFKALCPFHNEKTPSFVVNPQKQIFHCFGCSEGGNVISFVMKQEHLDFPEAARVLAQKANIRIPQQDKGKQRVENIRQSLFKINELALNYYHQNLIAGKDQEAKLAREYLINRGISLESVKTFQIGYALNQWDGLLTSLKGKKIPLSLMEKAGLIIPRENGQGYYDRFRERIIFPIFDTRLHCRAFGGRIFKEGLPGNLKGAKYINSPETPLYTKGHHLYGFHLTKQSVLDDDSVLIVEGYLDCLMPYQAGVRNIVATLGTALTIEQIRLLKRYTNNVIMLFDMDQAGSSAMIRSFDLLIEEGMNVKVMALDKGEDPDSFVRGRGVDIFRQRLSEAKPFFDYKLQSLFEDHDRHSIEGKARISAAMLNTIRLFPNAVIKTGYLKRLSQVLDIPESALIAEMNKLSQGQPAEVRPQPMGSKSNLITQPTKVESNILKLLLDENEYIGRTKAEVDLSDIQDARIREVMGKLFDLHNKGQKINIGQLVDSFQDQYTKQMIASLTVGEEAIDTDKNKMYQDFVYRIKQDKKKRRMKFLRVKIMEAESSGDATALDDLKKEFNQLIKNN